MKRLGTLILSAFALAAALTALPVSIDGHWTSQSTVRTKRGERTILMTFDFKSNGGAVTGSMTVGRGKRQRSIKIADGRLDGDRLTFSTKMLTRNGDRTTNWEGTVKDGGIALQRGGRRGDGEGRTLTLKRAP